MTDPNDQAYPTEYNLGLTKREAFVLAAMQGLLSRPAEHDPQTIAREAVQHADATLAELNKEKGDRCGTSADQDLHDGFNHFAGCIIIASEPAKGE